MAKCIKFNGKLSHIWLRLEHNKFASNKCKLRKREKTRKSSQVLEMLLQIKIVFNISKILKMTCNLISTCCIISPKTKHNSRNIIQFQMPHEWQNVENGNSTWRTDWAIRGQANGIWFVIQSISRLLPKWFSSLAWQLVASSLACYQTNLDARKCSSSQHYFSHFSVNICDKTMWFVLTKLLWFFDPFYFHTLGLALYFVETFELYLILRALLGIASVSVTYSGLILAIEYVDGIWRTIAGMYNLFPLPLSYIMISGIAYLTQDFKNLQLCIGLPGVFLCLLWYVWFLRFLLFKSIHRLVVSS